MPATNSAQLGKDAKAYSKAWGEKPKAFETCKGCKTPGYCKANGCAANEAERLKKLGG
jgi:hypothetical protein